MFSAKDNKNNNNNNNHISTEKAEKTDFGLVCRVSVVVVVTMCPRNV